MEQSEVTGIDRILFAVIRDCFLSKRRQDPVLVALGVFLVITVTDQIDSSCRHGFILPFFLDLPGIRPHETSQVAMKMFVRYVILGIILSLLPVPTYAQGEEERNRKAGRA